MANKNNRRVLSRTFNRISLDHFFDHHPMNLSKRFPWATELISTSSLLSCKQRLNHGNWLIVEPRSRQFIKFNWFIISCLKLFKNVEWAHRLRRWVAIFAHGMKFGIFSQIFPMDRSTHFYYKREKKSENPVSNAYPVIRNQQFCSFFGWVFWQFEIHREIS